MNKTFNAAALKNRPTEDKEADLEPATFKAEELTITITRANGDEVLSVIAKPRGFKPKVDKRSGGKAKGGVGWYVDVKGDDGAQYGDFAVSAGLRVSLHNVKVGPGDIVDLSDAGNTETAE